MFCTLSDIDLTLIFSNNRPLFSFHLSSLCMFLDSSFYYITPDNLNFFWLNLPSLLRLVVTYLNLPKTQTKTKIGKINLGVIWLRFQQLSLRFRLSLSFYSTQLYTVYKHLETNLCVTFIDKVSRGYSYLWSRHLTQERLP